MPIAASTASGNFAGWAVAIAITDPVRGSMTMPVAQAARVLRTWVEDFVDEDSGEVVSIERNEVVMERDTVLDEKAVTTISEMDVKSVFIQKEEVSGDYAIIYNTLNKDTSNSELEAVQHIYRQLRGADAPDNETARGIRFGKGGGAAAQRLIRPQSRDPEGSSF